MVFLQGFKPPFHGSMGKRTSSKEVSIGAILVQAWTLGIQKTSRLALQASQATLTLSLSGREMGKFISSKGPSIGDTTPDRTLL